MKLTHFNDIASLSSANASLIDFSGLCRLELKVKIFELSIFFIQAKSVSKGMNDISTKSSAYQTLENLLLQKSPTTRFQQIKEREAKDLHDQQSIPVAQPIVPEKNRTTSNVKPTS